MFAVTLANGKSFHATADGTLLDASRRQCLLFELCRTGRCGVCKSPVLADETRALRGEDALTPAEQAQGLVLTCARSAVNEVSLDIEDLDRLGEIEVRTAK